MLDLKKSIVSASFWKCILFVLRFSTVKVILGYNNFRSKDLGPFQHFFMSRSHCTVDADAEHKSLTSENML